MEESVMMDRLKNEINPDDVEEIVVY